MKVPDKRALIHAICETLHGQFEAFREASKRTRAVGNDEETKSEGKYDTRSIEENYLADGQARQAQTCLEAIDAFEKIPPSSLGSEDPIDLGALVQIKFPDGTAWFFVGPTAGGLEVECETLRFTIITPESPLGNLMMGKPSGTKISDRSAVIVHVA